VKHNVPNARMTSVLFMIPPGASVTLLFSIVGTESSALYCSFPLIPATDKKLHRYDAGHSLPADWTKAAFRDIAASLVDSAAK